MKYKAIACLFFVITCCSFVQQAIAQAKGIGVVFKKDTVTGNYTVTRLIAGNAAAEAGVREKDRIIAINGSPVDGKTITEVTTLLKGGSSGQPYTLSVQRTIKTSLGEKINNVDLTITPREISAQTCLSGDCKQGEGKLIDGTTGIVQEGSFVNGELVKGKKYFKSGRIMEEGNYKNGKLDGPGCTAYRDQVENSVWCKGRYENGKLREGMAYSPDHTSSTNGTYDDDVQLHGPDAEVYTKGIHYKGDMVHGQCEGYAQLLTYLNGTYKGPIHNCKPEGKGVYTTGDTRYIGNFANGKMEGRFKVKSSGYEYIYQYVNGEKQ